MKKVILALGLCSVSLAGFATELDKDFYAQLNLGFARGSKPGGAFGNNSMGKTGSYGVELGANVYENIRASLSFDYMSSFSTKYKSSVNLSPSVTYSTNNYVKVKSYVAMANLYYDIGEYDGFTPYVMVGAGVAKNKAGKVNGSGFDSEQPAENVSISVPGATKSNFAYKVGLGSRYELSEEVSLDLRYQFVNLGKFKTGSTQALTYVGSTEYQTVNNQGKLRGHELMLGVVYKF